ncbi:MAG: hypothetical protein IJZ80_05445 [Clostridia bacterium]|nr:hypothetical protein [Clostridia bacterium]
MKKTARTLISVLLLISMLLSMAVVASAEETQTNLPSIYTGTAVSVPTADEDGVIKLTTADQFVAWANLSSHTATKVELYTDVVFNVGDSSTWATTPPQYTWTPINGFTGTFDGRGHTISGLYHKATVANPAADASWIGLFGQVGGTTTIKNLGVVNTYFSTNGWYCGGIAARLTAGVTISGCYFDGIINCRDAGGGIVAMVSAAASSNATIKECASFGTIECTNTAAGGIVGLVPRYAADMGVTVVDCVNFATVKGGYHTGGIAGQCANININRCVNFGSVKDLMDSTDGITDALLGTVYQGESETSSTVSITNSYRFDGQLMCNFGAGGYSGVSALNDATASSGAMENCKSAVAATTLAAFDFAGTDANKGDWVTREGNYPMPKAVYDNFFKIKMKYVQNTAVDNKGTDATDDDTYDVRFIAEVSALTYDKVGFNVTVSYTGGSKTVTLTDTNVYKSIKAGTNESYDTVSAPDGKYFVALSITDIPTSADEVTFTVTPIGDYTDENATDELGDAYKIVYEAGTYKSATKAAA